MNTNQQPLLTYHVRVGHMDLDVKAHDPAEAIQLARQQLKCELPRLYDVICDLGPTKFQVEKAA